MDTHAIERDCEQLILRAAHLADQGQWEELAELFVQDGELVRPSNAGTSIRGREAILASMRTGHGGKSRRVITNFLVKIVSAKEALVSSIVTRYSGAADSGAGEEISIGHFSDEIVLTEQGHWAFRRRQGSMALEFKFRPNDETSGETPVRGR